MAILIIFLISVLITTLFMFIKYSNGVIYIKKLVLPFICGAFIICLIILSKTSIEAAKRGISLWIGIVFPSLFPFFVASELLGKTGFVRILGAILEPVMRPVFNVPGCGAYTFIMGITSGYPMGAKITAEMWEEGLMTRTEAERMLTFSNNSGPLFIFGAVAVGMFNMPKLGILLFVCHILACISVGIFFRFYKNSSCEKPLKKVYAKQRISSELKKLKNSSKYNAGNLFGDAIKNSVMMMLAIGGFIVFFSVLTSMLLDMGIVDALSSAVSAVTNKVGVGYDLVKSILSGFFEITTGSNMASRVQSAALSQRITAASFIIGWAGICVHSQVLGIIGHTDISIKPYLTGKFLQGILSAMFITIAIKMFPNYIIVPSSESFLYTEVFKSTVSWDITRESFCFSAFGLGFLLIFTVIILVLNSLRKKNSYKL